MRKFAITVAAIGLLAATGCTTNTPRADGAVLGGLLGAGLGAVVGNQSGHAAEGALIGAAAGGITGAAIGDAKAHNAQPQYQQQPQYQAAPPPTTSTRVVEGHYETRIVRGASGETYEERVWVPHN